MFAGIHMTLLSDIVVVYTTAHRVRILVQVTIYRTLRIGRDYFSPISILSLTLVYTFRRQTAVTTYFTSKQILSFDFAEQNYV